MKSRYIKHELKYMLLSKQLIWFSLLLTALFVFAAYLSYKDTLLVNDNYVRHINYLTENNIDIQEELKKDYKKEVSDDGSKVNLTNPLPYYKEQLEQHLFYAAPKNSISKIGALIPIFFPFTFVIMGMCTYIYDIKNKTIKSKTVLMGKSSYFFNKAASLAAACFIVVFISFAAASIINIIFYFKLLNSISSPIDLIKVSFNFKDFLLQLLFAVFLSIIYAFIGLLFGVIFRSVYVGIAFIFIRSFLPVLGEYDISNIINNFALKLYSYYGMVNIQVKGEPADWTICILIFTVIFCTAAGLFISLKRSSFV